MNIGRIVRRDFNTIDIVDDIFHKHSNFTQKLLESDIDLDLDKNILICTEIEKLLKENKPIIFMSNDIKTLDNIYENFKNENIKRW
jgi:hypothetical protein